MLRFHKDGVQRRMNTSGNLSSVRYAGARIFSGLSDSGPTLREKQKTKKPKTSTELTKHHSTFCVPSK